MKNKSPARTIGMIAFLLVLTYLYLLPGSRLLLSQPTDVMMSDGTDPAAAPYEFWLVQDTWVHHPGDLFYGAVPTRKLGGPEGMGLWFTWPDRAIIILGNLFLPPEQIYTFSAFAYVFLTALAFYLWCCVLELSWSITLFGTIAYGFSAFVLTRAKVHSTLAGIYHLPLIFSALAILKKNQTKKGVFLSSLLFLVAAFTAHYYLIICAFFSPFFLWYYFQGLEKNRANATRLILAILPAVLFVSYCFLNPLPKDYLNAFPKTGESPTWPHPFMTRFAAHPIDYLTGTFAIGEKDLNPIRKLISEGVAADLDDSNTHERTNGLRWLAIALFIVSAQWIFQRKKNLLGRERSHFIFFAVFGMVAFLVSLSPIWWGMPIGPSGWIHFFISQFRVPSRTGSMVLFAVVTSACLVLHKWQSQPRRGLKRWLFLPGVLPMLALLELPPYLNAMPLSRVLPVHTSLQANARPSCGYGLYFPYVSGTYALIEDYYFRQTMRGSNCFILNANDSGFRDKMFLRMFPLHQIIMQKIESHDEELIKILQHLVSCSRLDWLVFDHRVKSDWIKSFCDSLGWQMLEPNVCVSPQSQPQLDRRPEECFQIH